MNNMFTALVGTAGGIIGSIGGIGIGCLMVIVFLFIMFCVVPILCLFAIPTDTTTYLLQSVI